ncbi:MBL fold metallo-hydrolase [Arenibacterium halophilum]|jgi:glyoxylase-like metal-dependent hydrolase (beta-lactamase superfamily II)|uniref:MBL fold metallo-hydrolase n=1 Tax=Arenibacterium halophilum TaxID=2583821 RepID=A0ABY2XEW3_9RHOB|nr:MBL fold metallo-hydrolase [Arenibacterium halophilum]MAY88720.1 MBL fold metallo-hydrolase [Pseudooceanicola sp.]TMV15161.1 MBL fold metallo-hydrolase [Arenibacterium halophilum]
MQNPTYPLIHDTLQFPLDAPPDYGTVQEVAEGVLWLRIPLPFQLDHVNIYLLRDGDGWAMIDTGIKTKQAIEMWETLFDGPLKGFQITRIIVTHHHPDHIGLAGWLCDRTGAQLLTSQTAFMTCRVISLAPQDFGSRQYFDFYSSHGMESEAAGLVAIQGNEYLKLVSPLPTTYLRLVLGDLLTIGERQFRVLTGDGHAPEQIMLYCEADRLLFAADQVLERISPNVSVFAGEPNGDPLGHFLRSLRLLGSEIPDDTLVLAGHRRPFLGLHQRCAELEEHHEERCDRIRKACAERPHSVAELVPILFTRPLDPHQMSFAFSETLAHANRLIRRGEIEEIEKDGKKFCQKV